jgi:hypothetical protein
MTPIATMAKLKLNIIRSDPTVASAKEMIIVLRLPKLSEM